ncbi:MAG TPA: hypothetical protein VM324_15905 [Egibacteraceae bacterium]|nr:hypothetical protein [Egibacteraceae bacterium]
MQRAEGGFVTVQYVAVVGLSLLFVVMLANLVVFQYGRGVVRAALDEGARAGTRTTAGAAECEARAGDVLADLLGGAMGAGVRLRCADDGDLVRASADVVFVGWLPAVPDWRFTAEATASRRPAP